APGSVERASLDRSSAEYVRSMPQFEKWSARRVCTRRRGTASERPLAGTGRGSCPVSPRVRAAGTEGRTEGKTRGLAYHERRDSGVAPLLPFFGKRDAKSWGGSIMRISKSAALVLASLLLAAGASRPASAD